MSLLTPIAAKMHGELEHASHEDCVVTITGPIHCPGVNVMRVGAHDDVPECPVQCQRHARMSVEGIQVVLVVIDGPVQSS